MFFDIRTVFPTAGMTLGEWQTKPKDPLNEQTCWLISEWEQSCKKGGKNLEI